MELEAATRADGTRACQIKAPVVRVYDEGLLKIVDGVVPDLCDDEWRRLGALWSSRRFIQAENTKRIEQTFLAGIGNKTISDTQIWIEKMVDARPFFQENYDGSASAG